MKLARVAAVFAVLGMLSGCASSSPPVALGGDGISFCSPSDFDEPFALVVPVQNSGDEAVTLDSVTANLINATLEKTVFVGEFAAESDDTLASASGGGESDVPGIANGTDATETSIPAHSRGELAIVFSASDETSSLQGITATFGDTTLTSAATVEFPADGCGG